MWENSVLEITRDAKWTDAVLLSSLKGQLFWGDEIVTLVTGDSVGSDRSINLDEIQDGAKLQAKDSCSVSSTHLRAKHPVLYKGYFALGHKLNVGKREIFVNGGALVRLFEYRE